MDLKVYHNPDDQCIVIETGSTVPSALKLFDMIGNLIIATEVEDKEHLSIKHLKSGLYYYRVTATDRLQIGKILIGS